MTNYTISKGEEYLPTLMKALLQATGARRIEDLNLKDNEYFPDEGLEIFDVCLYGKEVGIVFIYEYTSEFKIHYKTVEYETERKH